MGSHQRHLYGSPMPVCVSVRVCNSGNTLQESHKNSLFLNLFHPVFLIKMNTTDNGMQPFHGFL